MSRMRVREIWGDMARRKIQFHADEEWQNIWLWGLFNWSDVSRQLERGELHTWMKKEHKVIWVYPSEEAYHKHIEPLLQLPPNERWYL